MDATLRRLFIALPVDDPNALDSLKNEIQYLEKFRPVLKIVPEDNFHITIKFLGQVEQDKADTLIESFRSLTGLKKTEYRVEGTGAFPSPGNPSVIWAGMKCDNTNLDDIVKKVEQFASENGFPPEKKKFSPHLTLARTRREKKIPQELKEHISKGSSIVSGLSAFNELVLYESILKKNGPEYKKISVVQLE
jgi:2'-5' RNA ligase